MWKMKTRQRTRRNEWEKLTCRQSSGIRCARWALKGYFHLRTPAVRESLGANFSSVEKRGNRCRLSVSVYPKVTRPLITSSSSVYLTEAMVNIHSCATQKRAGTDSTPVSTFLLRNTEGEREGLGGAEEASPRNTLGRRPSITQIPTQGLDSPLLSFLACSWCIHEHLVK